MFYETLNGEPTNEELSHIYWAHKNAGSLALETAFEVCSNENCNNPSDVSGLSSSTYTF